MNMRLRVHGWATSTNQPAHFLLHAWRMIICSYLTVLWYTHHETHFQTSCQAKLQWYWAHSCEVRKSVDLCRPWVRLSPWPLLLCILKRWRCCTAAWGDLFNCVRHPQSILRRQFSIVHMAAWWSWRCPWPASYGATSALGWRKATLLHWVKWGMCLFAVRIVSCPLLLSYKHHISGDVFIAQVCHVFTMSCHITWTVSHQLAYCGQSASN